MSSSDSTVQPSVSGYSRKRRKHVEQWKKVEAKRKRNTGAAYINCKTKQLVAARVVGPPCVCGCFNNLGMDKIKVIFDNYWALGDYNQQNVYLAKLVSYEDVKRCRIKDRPSRTQRRIRYIVLYDNNVHTMCPKAFYSIHGISERRVRTVLAKQTVSGTTEHDKRGTGPSVSKISDERKQTVHEHVNSLPKVSSNYSRAKSLYRKYLPTGLNVNILYSMYCEWMKNNHEDIEPVSNRYYRDVFNQDFNVGCETPKSDVMSKVKCFITCVNGTHDAISLSNLKPVTLGRSSETKIKDKRCSKKQVELTADCNEFIVKYKHLGSNCGGLKGTFTKSGEVYELFHEDVVEFLYGKHPHKIIFETEPPLVVQNTDFEEVVTKTDLLSMPPRKKNKNTLKRGRDESEEMDPKKHCATAKENEWESFYDDDLLVYNQHGSKSNKIASYDMDGTLITTVSGRVFAKDINDWKLIYSQVPGKLKKLCAEGYKIVLFTNQLGVGKGKITVKEIQKKIASVIEKLGVPAQALVATGKGKYRKPVTGMWDFFVEECNGGMEVDKDSSVYVGDAAGRPEIPKQRKKDHSVADRLFALNIGIPFSTPEEHFLDNKPSSYKMPDFIPSEIEASSPYNPVNTKVPKHPVEAILMVGFPGSGKSTFVEKNLLKLGYIPTNRDTLGTWQKCVSLMEKSLRDGKHVVIDNTNPDKASRKRYIEVAEKLNVPIRCFVLDISLNQSKHNNKFRELTGSDHSKVSDMIYNMYKSKFEEPTLKEGFSDIVKVNFVPSFKNSEMEEFYKTYLLEN